METGRERRREGTPTLRARKSDEAAGELGGKAETRPDQRPSDKLPSFVGQRREQGTEEMRPMLEMSRINKNEGTEERRFIP